MIKKILLLTFLISFCGFSQVDDLFQKKLIKTDTIKDRNQRIEQIRKLFNDVLTEKINVKSDTIKVNFTLYVNDKGSINLEENNISDAIISDKLNKLIKNNYYLVPFLYKKKPFKVYIKSDYDYVFQDDGTYKVLKNKVISFSEIEQVPIYPSCKGNKKELTACLNKYISKHIIKNFNINLAQSLNLKVGKKRISVQFVIDKKGNVIDIKTKAPHPKLIKEAIRIIELLPQMIPGKQKGKAVKVRYNLPINFMVTDDPIIETPRQKKLRLKSEKRKRQKAAQAKRLKKFSE